MSRNHNRISKLVTAIGILGLMVWVSVPKVSAAPPAVTNPVSSFTVKNYSGRYVCTTASGTDFFSAVIKYGPNGFGAYSGGTLVASIDSFPGGTPGLSSSFCTYTLDLASSSYNIAADGTGFEELVWDAASTNNVVCPGSFEDQTAINLRNNQNSAGQVLNAQFSSADLLGQAAAGHGECLK